MQIITHQLYMVSECKLPDWISWNSSVCIDIETTGLSPASSYLYLIGCTYSENGHFYVRQWLSEGIEQEELILQAFCEWISKYRCLIHFNGIMFDIPYLSAKCKKYSIELSFEKFEQVDLYKRLYPFRRLLPLENLKQKTVERFLKIDREDSFSGSELIPVYTAYLGRLRYEVCVLGNANTGSPFHAQSCSDNRYQLMNPALATADLPSPEQIQKALQTEGRLPAIPAAVLCEVLLRHNREDAANLPRLLQMLSYTELFRGHFSCERAQTTDSALIMELCSETSFPTAYELTVPLSLKIETACCCQLSFEGHICVLTIPLYQGEVRHYYENYKDYYYLIEEGIVSHKSVAGFVSAKYRRKAKPEECCYLKSGIFLPQTESMFEPFYYKEYKEIFSWFEVTNELADEFRKNANTLTQYAKKLLFCMTGQL